MRNCLYLVLVLSLVFAGLLQAQTSEERLQKLEKICLEQKQQIENLQERLGVLQDETSYKQYTESIVKEYLGAPAIEDDGMAITAGYDNGFFVRDPEGNVELKITGYLQTGLGIFENNALDDNSFFLNGAYLNFDLFLMKDWHARIQIDFADISPVVRFRNAGGYGIATRDAYIEYIGIPEFSVRVGNTHVPFSIEGQYGETESMLIGTTPFTYWSHGRDLGFMVHGVISDVFGYKAGLFNGEGSMQGNESDDMLMAAQARFYYCGYELNPKNFFHVGVLRNRSVSDGVAALASPWGRVIYAAAPNATDDDVNGWRTAVDAGFSYDSELEGGHGLRVESEFMYSTWERDMAAGRRSWLDGYGWLIGMSYRHCLDPEVEGSGVITGFHFSYTDIDNDGDSGNIPGQRAYTYTMILGYAFNTHLSVAFNWIMMDLDNKSYYGGAKADNDVSTGVSGGLEHAWLFQVTAQW
jgi:hypothetical protein